jgi:hypothetical protein
MIGASIDEWWPETYDQFEIGLDSDEKHSGTRSAYIKSVVSKPTEFGELSQTFVTNNYFGKRIKMSAWVKSRLTSGTAQLWIRVDGEWTTDKPGCFDNMEDRPITGDTNWSQYSLVVDVPDNSSHVTIGCFITGTGQVWMDDYCLETVSKDVPLTGSYATLTGYGKTEPLNLNFEQKSNE